LKYFKLSNVATIVGVLCSILLIYILLSLSLKDNLAASAKYRLNMVSSAKVAQVEQLLKVSQRDLLSFYDWASFSNIMFQPIGSGKVASNSIEKSLQRYADQFGFRDVVLFDAQQKIVARYTQPKEIHLRQLTQQYFTSQFEPLLRSSIETLRTSYSPFLPTLEDLYSKPDMNSSMILHRVSYLIAPLIIDNELKGSVALARHFKDFEMFDRDALQFDQDGTIVLVESANDAVFGIHFPRDLQGDPEILKVPHHLSSHPMNVVMNPSSDIAFYSDDSMSEQLVKWHFIPDLNLGMLFHVPSDRVFSEVQKYHWLALVSLFASLVIAAIWGVSFSNGLLEKFRGFIDRLSKLAHYGENHEFKGSEVLNVVEDLIDKVESRIEKDDVALQSSKQRLRFFMKELEDQRFAFDQHCIIIVADADGTFTDVNEQFSQISGYSRSELLGSTFKRFGGHYQNERVMKDIFETMNSGKVWQGELSLTKRNGDLYWLETTFVPFVNDDSTLRNVVAIHTDITEQKLAYADMIHQAQYDVLTGLPNRALLLDRLGQMLRNSRRNNSQVGVLFLDLDDFKKINDSLGHEVGDELLVEVGRRLKGVIRDQDTVGRLGGDEFLVLLNGTEFKDDVEVVARKIIDTIKEPIGIEDYELVVGVSIGIAIYPEDGQTESEMLRHADSAMYNAKKMGRNSFSYFTEAMNKEVARRLEIESWMNGAIERGEFSVVFQPIVSVMSGKFATVEALVRWAHPQGGNISPDEFIPIAEHSGYIMDIGKYVLDKSLRLASEWRQRYRSDLIVAINVSPRQFRDPNWHGGIEDQLATHGLTARNIEFEITEGVLISGNENVEKALIDFSNLGIAISMDDFGTGYSSLSYLRNYPFDTLKIDRSFVNDIVEDHADYELVSAAIAMAHGLGLEVVAEGVETAEQYELLYHRRCDYAQGYFFSPPVNGDQILSMGGILPSDTKIRQQRLTADMSKKNKFQKGGDE